ncbi:MAG TPA: FAD/NAD(P)-binding protein [Bryobacteraceae bacterium]
MASKKHGDDALGMNAPIERRDLLNSTLIAAGSLLLNSVAPLDLLAEEDWTGFGGIGDYAASNGNTYEVMTAGHKIRDRVWDKAPHETIETGEEFDCVVVGGGISGLAAALFLERSASRNARPPACLVIDNHPIFGGEAKRNEFLVNGQRLMAHQGSAACFPPLGGTFLAEFYDSAGIDWRQFQYQKWAGTRPELTIQTAPYPVGGPTSAFFFGAKFGHPEGLWLKDPWGKRLAGAPLTERIKRELLSMRDTDRKPFSTHRLQPKEHGDAASRHLDSMTLENHLIETYGLSVETIRTFLSPITGGGSGLGADVLSAYCEYAADVLLPWDYKQGAQMFPGGNTGVARHILKQLIPDAIAGGSSMTEVCRGRVQFSALDRAGQPARLRLGATVISVKHDGEPNRARTVEILYSKGNKLCRARAKTVVMAGGSWTTKRVVRDLPPVCREAYAQFYRAPCVMANVAVTNWRFLYRLGLTECQWFEGIGNYLTMRKVATFGSDPATIDPDSPAVLNLKILFSKPGLGLAEQTTGGRAELLSTPFRSYERQIREQFTALFGGAGFDSSRDIAGIILNRWGHAYLSPQPGFFFGQDGKPGPGDVIRQNPYGRIAFANSDLAGIMDHRMSILEARRAVNQIVDKIG